MTMFETLREQINGLISKIIASSLIILVNTHELMCIKNKQIDPSLNI